MLVLSLCFVYVCLGLVFCVFFCFNLEYFAVFAFVVLGLVSAVLCQEIGWKECLQNDLFCDEWDIKP